MKPSRWLPTARAALVPCLLTENIWNRYVAGGLSEANAYQQQLVALKKAVLGK